MADDATVYQEQHEAHHAALVADADVLLRALIAAPLGGLTFRYHEGDIEIRAICPKCWQPHWREASNLIQVGQVLEVPDHDYDCTAPEPKGPVYVSPSEKVQQAANALEAAGKAFGDATAFEQTLEDDRPAKKREAIQRLMTLENPLTSKAHSASSAEAVVETDPEYRAYRVSQSEAVVAKLEAEGVFEAAKVRAQLALENMRAGL